MYLIYRRTLAAESIADAPPTPTTQPNLLIPAAFGLSGGRPEGVLLSASSATGASVTVAVWAALELEGAVTPAASAEWVVLARDTITAVTPPTAAQEKLIGLAPGSYYVQVSSAGALSAPVDLVARATGEFLQVSGGGGGGGHTLQGQRR
jgi:hypothetical protein